MVVDGRADDVDDHLSQHLDAVSARREFYAGPGRRRRNLDRRPRGGPGLLELGQPPDRIVRRDAARADRRVDGAGIRIETLTVLGEHRAIFRGVVQARLPER